MNQLDAEIYFLQKIGQFRGGVKKRRNIWVYKTLNIAASFVGCK